MTCTLVMSGLKYFSVSLVPAVKGSIKSKRMALSDMRWGLTRMLSLVSLPFGNEITLSRITWS